MSISIFGYQDLEKNNFVISSRIITLKTLETNGYFIKKSQIGLNWPNMGYLIDFGPVYFDQMDHMVSEGPIWTKIAGSAQIWSIWIKI